MYNSKKRPFADDEDEIETPDHDHKKPRTLPFRTSPSSRHSHLYSNSARAIPNPPTITPADSDTDEPLPAYPSSTPPNHDQFSSRATSIYISSSLAASNVEDQDMSDSPPTQTWTSTTTVLGEQRLTPPESTDLSSHATNPVSTGRIPTPIYGHFYLAPLSTQGSDISMDSDTDDIISVANSSPLQRSDMENKRRRRRLPSPISEDENSLTSPTTIAGSMLGQLEVGGVAGDGHQRAEDGKQGLKSGNSMENFSWRKDATREAGSGKTTISMGYRADCEKCRMKVPGHYSHIVRR